MAETSTGQKKMYDPFEPFRGMRDAYLESVSKAMIDVVNTESYAQATGAMLDCYLTASAPFREALEKSMLQAMQQLSIPSRQEVAALAERFTNVEMRLDDVDAKLDNLARELAAALQTAVKEAVKETAVKEAVVKEPAAKEPAAKEPPSMRPAPGAFQHPRRGPEGNGPRK